MSVTKVINIISAVALTEFQSVRRAAHSQLTFICAKLKIETPNKGLKYVQN